MDGAGPDGAGALSESEEVDEEVEEERLSISRRISLISFRGSWGLWAGMQVEESGRMVISSG